MNCDRCGRFHDHGPGSAWKMVYSGGPIPMPDHEISRCKKCVEKFGPFNPQCGIKEEYSCGMVAHNNGVDLTQKDARITP